MKSAIPNFITLLNVLCGSIAAVYAAINELEIAALFVFLGIFFDFLDGLAARLLNAKSAIGVQLDSLADMITSGLVPGIVMFQLLGMSVSNGWNTVNDVSGIGKFIGFSFDPVVLVGFLITMASAYRLANFNVDEDQVSSFRGLPTPANALLILSLPLILFYQGSDILNEVILNKWFLIGLTLVSAFLLNSRIRLFALKFKNWGFKDNAVRYLFIVGSLVMLATLKFLAIPLIIVFYILSSLVVKVE